MDIAAIEALASTASAALVTAAVTDVFEGVRHRIARLFGRGEPDPAIQQRLARTQDRLAACERGELEPVRAALAAQWQTRFFDLLTDHPDAEPEVRELVDELRGLAPVVVSASDHAVSAGRDVNVTASGGGFAAGVVHGDVTPPGPSVPGPADG